MKKRKSTGDPIEDYRNALSSMRIVMLNTKPEKRAEVAAGFENELNELEMLIDEPVEVFRGNPP